MGPSFPRHTPQGRPSTGVLVRPDLSYWVAASLTEGRKAGETSAGMHSSCRKGKETVSITWDAHLTLGIESRPGGRCSLLGRVRVKKNGASVYDGCTSRLHYLMGSVHRFTV